MKPGIINMDRLTWKQRREVAEWILANGCRHLIPADCNIIYTGNRLIIPTWNIERLGQRNPKWAQRISGRELRSGRRTKVRTYQVRVPFEAAKNRHYVDQLIDDLYRTTTKEQS